MARNTARIVGFMVIESFLLFCLLVASVGNQLLGREFFVRLSRGLDVS
jgi:hypothetical protein